MREHPATDPAAARIVDAIRAGDLVTLEHCLRGDPGLARALIVTPGQGSDPAQKRSLLHIATDWPGHYPNGPAVIALLVRAGAVVDTAFVGPHRETPLHWAASTNDVGVVDALLDAGADIEAPGSVIDGGPALSDAVAFGQWDTARRLVERGARTTGWQAAALGLTGPLLAWLAASPSRADIDNAFWCACHGGRRETAEILRLHGADLERVGHDGLTPLEAAERAGARGLVVWLESRTGRLSLDPVATTDGVEIQRMLVEMGPGENGFQTGADDLETDGPAAWLRARVRMAEGLDLLPNQVPMVTYWLRRAGHPIGMSKLRVRLTDGLRRLGGHIGFCVRPTERGKGYAPVLLAMTLERAREAGVESALLTCNVDNEPSWRTIERCGGRLEKIENDHRYYWIETARSP